MQMDDPLTSTVHIWLISMSSSVTVYMYYVTVDPEWELLARAEQHDRGAAERVLLDICSPARHKLVYAIRVPDRGPGDRLCVRAVRRLC